MPFPDLHVLTEQSPCVAPQSMAAAATVHGTGVDVSDCEAAEVEVSLGTLAGAPTGGTVTAIIEHSDDDSTWTQVNGTDDLVGNYNDTLPEVLRYRYIGDLSAGKKRYLRASVTTALTGGTSPTVIVAVNVLKGGMRYAGQMPTIGSAPQTVSSGIKN